MTNTEEEEIYIIPDIRTILNCNLKSQIALDEEEEDLNKLDAYNEL